MKYLPEFTNEEVFSNHLVFKLRRDIYKNKGLDFIGNREFIFGSAVNINGNILEIGTGKGITAVFLAKNGYDIVSIDKNTEMLKIAALNLSYEKVLEKVELHVMDAYEMEFEDKSFDNIVMIEALHHIEDIDGLFSEINRVFTGKGRVIFSDFNEKGMKIVDDVHKTDGHVHANSFLGKEEVKNGLESRGYNIKTYDDNCHWVLIGDKENG